MASLEKLLVRMSDWLDKGRPGVEKITVNCTRQSAMKAGTRPEKRGGPLYFRGRQVDYKPRPR